MDWKALQIIVLINVVSFLVLWNVSLKDLFYVMRDRLLAKRTKLGPLVTDLVTLARMYPVQTDSMREVVQKSENRYFSESFELMMEGVLDPKSLERALHSKSQNFLEPYMNHSEKFRLLSQISAVLGLVGVLYDASFAGSVLGTTFGLIYGVYLPISYWLEKRTEHDYMIQKVIKEGLRLVCAKNNPIVVAEVLKAYLPMGEEINWTAPALTHKKKAS